MDIFKLDIPALVWQLNLAKLAASILCANRGVTWLVLREVQKAVRIMHKNPAVVGVQFAWSLLLHLIGFGVKIMRRIWNRFRIIIGMKAFVRIDGIENMVEASHALTHYLKENGYSFSVHAMENR